MQIPFIGPSYTTRSINFDAQRTLNFYPIISESGKSKNIEGLQATPGLLTFSDLANGPVRGGRAVKGRAFFVSGNKLYEIDSAGVSTERGTLLTYAGNVSLSDNGLQLVMVDGPYGYILTLATNVFQRITSIGFLGADTVTFADGYFLFNRPGTGIYYITSLYDGFTIDGLDFASAEGSPDNLIAVMALHRDIWLFGTNSIEVAFNSGAAAFPFTRIEGAFIEYGCIAPASVAKTANTLFWLGQDEYGSGVVWMATGYQPQRISTFAVETAIQGYANISDSVGYTYQEDGHYFYVMNFPSANTTWVYDVNLNQWHERAFWNIDSADYERHRAQNHIFCFGKHLVGDYANGKVYEQSLNHLDDDGSVIRRLRAAPHTFDDDNLNYIYYRQFQLDMQVGVGNAADPDPQIILQWSNDGGYTWSNEHARPIGKVGEYKKKAEWRQLGRSKDRVFRAVTTARAKLCLIGAHIEAERGNTN